jgi:hypothetical protein
MLEAAKQAVEIAIETDENDVMDWLMVSRVLNQNEHL